MIQYQPKGKFISVAELAKLLGISRVAVFKKIKKGQLPAEKIGRAYAISSAVVSNLLQAVDTNVLTEPKKKEIEQAVVKVVAEYGETLRLLGKE